MGGVTTLFNLSLCGGYKAMAHSLTQRERLLKKYRLRQQKDVSEWLVCLYNVSFFICVVTVTTM